MNHNPRNGYMGDTDPCYANQSNEYSITLIQSGIKIMSQHPIS